MQNGANALALAVVTYNRVTPKIGYFVDDMTANMDLVMSSTHFTIIRHWQVKFKFNMLLYAKFIFKCDRDNYLSLKGNWSKLV